MKIDFYGKSDIGKFRRTNEDYFFNEKIGENEYLFIVADGMGGHQAGEVASQLGTNSFVEEYKTSRSNNRSIGESMVRSLKKANLSILKRASSDPQKRGMGTTFTGCVLKNGKATVIHVGDSRIYQIRKNKINKITTDHTFVEKMLAEGKITEEEARDHPQKNILYMSLGARETYVPEIITDLTVEDGDILTICTDGLNNMVGDDQIKEYALAYDPERSVEELIKLANENGGTDNITIQMIHTGETSKHRTEPIKRFKKNRLRSIWLPISAACLIGIGILWIKNKETDTPTSYDVTRPKPPVQAASAVPIKKSDANTILTPLPAFSTDKSKLDNHQIINFSYGRLIFRQQNQLTICNVDGISQTQSLTIEPSDKWIPGIPNPSETEKSPVAGIQNERGGNQFTHRYLLLKRAATKSLRYRLYDPLTKTNLVHIQSDNELNSINHESRTVKFLNLKAPLSPIFFSSRVFVFHDAEHYYVIENPLPDHGELKFFKLDGIQKSEEKVIGLQNTGQFLYLILYDQNSRLINILDIPSSRVVSTRKIVFNTTEKPIGLEYLKNDVIRLYFGFGYLAIYANNSFTQSHYLANNQNLVVKQIWIDHFSNKRIVVDNQNNIYIFGIGP